MAKMPIIANQTKAKDSASVNASALAIPLAYATNYGAAISTIGKAIGAIQADLHKIEDENQFNEIMPKITADMSTAYNKYKNSSDVVNVPGLFEKEVEFSKWKKELKPYNENVKRLVKQSIYENKINLLPKLINKVSDNAVYKYKDGIGKNFNLAMLNIVSGDAGLVGLGSIQFSNLSNNKAYEEFIGAEEWRKIVEAKELQLAELLIDSDINLNPTNVIKNRELLKSVVGTDKADFYVNKANEKLVANMKDNDRKNTWEEIKDQDDKISVFTDMLLRINAFKKDTSLVNEAPTAAMLYDAYDDGFINKAMFNMLTNALTDDYEQSDSEIVGAITSAFYSAESFEMMEGIKRAIFLDENTLRKIGLQDMTAFTNIVDGAKKNFPAFKETKEYAKKIEANIGSFAASASTSFKKRTQLETLKNNVIMEYHDYIDQGYSAKNAYLKVLTSSSFLKEAVPTLQVSAKPTWMKGMDMKAMFEKADKEGVNLFDKLNQDALMYFKGFTKPDKSKVRGHNNHQQFLLDLENLDLLEKIFNTRLNLGGIEYALEGKSKNPLDDIYGKK